MIALRWAAVLHRRADAPQLRFAVALFGALAYAAWGWQASPSLPAPQPVIPPDLPAQADQGVGFAAIAGMHLFGVYHPPAIAPPAPVVLREASRDFRLQGVFTGRDDADMAALIMLGSDTPARRFVPGDPVGDGAELVSVALDHVVLRRDGELERLSLHRSDRAGSSPTDPATARARLASRSLRHRRPAIATFTEEPERADVVTARLRRLRAGEA